MMISINTVETLKIENYFISQKNVYSYGFC
jgi:hypothetical protein